MLIESVPNVSEGRRLDVVDRLAEAIEAGPASTSSTGRATPSHNRSVFTMAGEHGPVSDALERLVAAAIHEIDMEAHIGEHPRIGAVDVIPFVPLGDTTMDDCVELARAFGERIATRFDLPVYLYAKAATRPDRVKLADVRRGQYEGSRPRSTSDGREPDFGPARMHPSAGAVAVGARPFLIAYNINLDSADVELAKRIARRVRESGGGLPRVQANGFWIEELGRAQVSMNLLDFAIDAALARLGDGPRDRRRGRRRARRIGADRARAAGGLPGRRRPRRRAARRTRSSARLAAAAASSGCATSRRCRPSSSVSRPPGASEPAT